MKVFFSFFLLLCAFVANAQHTFQKVNHEQIKAAVTDANSPSHYPKLLARLAASDTILTLEDYRNLYYGYVFEPSYNGYMDHKKARITALLKANQYAAAIATCDSILAQIPISLNANFLKGYALFELDKTDPKSVAYRTRYRKLRDAILSSGDGLTCETGFKTIFISDEYDIMYHYLEVESFTSQSLVIPCDMFSIEPSKYFKATSLYFDTSETLLSMQNQLGSGKSKKRRK